MFFWVSGLQKLGPFKPKEKIRCPNCLKVAYKNSYTLAKHLKYECSVTPKFECFDCHKKFKRKYHLMRHLAVTHNKVR